jgi:hypothetical protein
VHEMKPAVRGAVYARRPFGGPLRRFPIGFAPLPVVLGFVALASSGPYFSYFPLVPLFFVFAFFVAPALGRSMVRGNVSQVGGAAERRPAPNGEEKELLRALERYEEITAARAALETSLSVSEAEEMLAKLASGGHVEVRAHDGTLAYALRVADRRGGRPKELEDAGHGPSE